MATGGFGWLDDVANNTNGPTDREMSFGWRCSLCNGELSFKKGERSLPCLHHFCIKCSATQGNVDCALCAHRPMRSTSYTSVNHQHQQSPHSTSTSICPPFNSSLDATHGNQFSDPLTIDTSFLIGNLLDAVTLKDTQHIDNLPVASNTQFSTSQNTTNPFGFDLGSIGQISKPFGVQNSVTPNRPQCTSCMDGLSATSRCEECQEYLCAGCIQAHLRVRVTRDHHVTPLNMFSTGGTSSGSSAHSPMSPTNNTGTCSVHQESVSLLCVTCSIPICIQCLPDHKGHGFSYLRKCDSRALTARLLVEARQYQRGLDEMAEAVERMNERVDARVLSVANEVRAVLHHHISALEERKRDLLQRIDLIRKAKVTALEKQREELRQRLNEVKNEMDHLDQLLSGVQPESIWNSQLVNDTTLSETQRLLLRLLENRRLPLTPQETDHIVFSAPEPTLLSSIRSLGVVQTAAFAGHTTIVGEAYRRAIRDRPSYLTVQARDHVGDLCTQGGDAVVGEVDIPNGSGRRPLQVQDRQNGTYLVSYTPKCDGEHKITIRVRGCPIAVNPFTIRVRKGRDYSQIGSRPILSFGTEGSNEGQLCRPWGICCDREGRIIVADRSNNRIQLFDKDGNLLFKFGTAGARPGQFDRPAGVCVNSKNQMIIADKDNHRIQVFDSEGTFLFKFGEKGRGVGQFNYPWDVATNAEDQIAASDTRNHRVQLFTSTGSFVRKFGFDNSLFYKHFDSPRGVCFLPDGQLLVTDFNNHRLVLLSLQSNDMKFYGREGDWDGAYRRPQGLDVDPEGHVIVADSRNNRMQVLNPELRPLCTFGWDATDRTSVMDRPCDVCAAPDGRIYVVDFGNNKIHIF